MKRARGNPAGSGAGSFSGGRAARHSRRTTAARPRPRSRPPSRRWRPRASAGGWPSPRATTGPSAAGRVSLLMVRPLGTPQAAFDVAAAAFEALRRRALQPA